MNKHNFSLCPNPIHKFKIGGLVGLWQWADDYWGDVVGGRLVRHYMLFCSKLGSDGIKSYTIVFFKLHATWSFV